MNVIPKELQISLFPLTFQSIAQRSVGFEHSDTPHFHKIVRTQLKTRELIFALVEKSGRRERRAEGNLCNRYLRMGVKCERHTRC
jgi:hypothetical protein